jgi:hypothetical protein
MTEESKVTVELTAQEREMIDLLKKEMGLASTDEVLRLLLRQALQRRAVVCPTCGHVAQKTAADAASCSSCLSVLHLSEGIWQAMQSHAKTK